MTHTPLTSTTAPGGDARTPQPSRTTFGGMLEELIDLSAGLGVALLPVLLPAVPGIILFVVLPAILLLALAVPLAAIGAAITAPPYLLARWLRRRRPPTLAPGRPRRQRAGVGEGERSIAGPGTGSQPNRAMIACSSSTAMPARRYRDSPPFDEAAAVNRRTSAGVVLLRRGSPAR